MRRLSSLIVFACWALTASAQNPHGDLLKVNCAACHSPSSWKMDLQNASFRHEQTSFPLTGRHKDLNCKACHLDLVFNKVSDNCATCHQDPHQNSVGIDCKRCHNSSSWIVDDIANLHLQNGFTLLGQHAAADCKSCHVSESQLRFDRIGNDCISCHLPDYEHTTKPDHSRSGLSKDCASCHDPASSEWNSPTFKHDKFALTGVHDVPQCVQCHTSPDYSSTSSDCYSCHKTDYESSLNPNHQAAALSKKCTDCHVLMPDWKPAEFKEHDGLYFPIYSGGHKNEWLKCNDCHLNPSNYKTFSCVVCHKQTETGEDHKSVSGYFYNDAACFACHPTGNKGDKFDHNTTGFILTNAHAQTECVKCHSSGFKGTPTECVACHLPDFQQSQNPSHNKLNLSTDCASCHTTLPGWSPAKFEIHDQFYVLEGAHQALRNDCSKCHNGDYNNTPNNCLGCHQQDYDQTQNPPHKALQFSTECTQCHSQTAWVPSSFDHDGQYFPIYSGKHKGQWNECRDCHSNPSNIRDFSCIICHKNPVTDDDHRNVSGYFYNDKACFACHPTGDASFKFDHNTTGFILTGAHVQTDCIKCHATGFKGTPTQCASCHLTDFNQSKNPEHPKLGLSNDCAGCHTTNPGWMPATFAIHDQFYPLKGAHKAIAMDCAGCHKGDYINTPNTCSGCHIEDYNKTIDPPHKTLQFSTECTQCHNESAWVPSSFDHDGKYFPIYSGKHKGKWMECRDCHNNPNNIREWSCIVCHLKNETDDDHKNVRGYFYNDQACFACHPDGRADFKFDHNTTGFVLTGAHTQADCIKCHANGFKGTSTVCADCHTPDFNQSVNPNHTKIGLSLDCAQCHTTNPGWSPASFAIHDQYYPLNGAHKQISSNCAVCHKGDYNQTPNTCSGCHEEDYKQTKNPDHQSLQFSTDCASCHTENTWVPSTFDHDGKYFPIYSGKHKNEWTECIQCHINPANYKEFSCTICHINPETNDKHTNVTGYYYNDLACLGCHPTGSGDDKFDHNNTAFPLTGAHLQVDCKLCHTKGFKGTPMECESCHLTDYQNSTNPDHKKLSLSMACATCHTTAPDWKPALFADHDTYYPLTGKHLDIANDCNACHKGNYNNTPNTCVGCHLEHYNQSKNPNHPALGLSQDCALCHTTKPMWEPATFPVHDQFYPLTGAHLAIAADCAVCHKGDYNNTPNTCEGCHLKDYQNSKNPNHVVLNFPQDCKLCHTTNPDWKPASMPTHDIYYPLTGAHQAIAMDCAACHKGDYNNTPKTCEGCHLKDYNSSTNPNHKNLGLSHDCAICHTTNPDWKPALFPDHDNYYPLHGAHMQIANECVLCHNGNYNNTPKTCVGCHLADYNQASDPPHEAQKFPKTCADCHTETAWVPSFFNHNNYYPLTGAHDLIKDECFACHMGNYGNTPKTCYGCHTADFNQATNPNHVNLGFSTNCTLCHTTNPNWEPATMPTHNNYYPLLGAHLAIANQCVLCHNGNYNNTPNTCVGCHIDDYNQTSNPNHQAAQFPTNCESCHSVNAWVPSTFNHDGMYFPIFSGKHKNEWNVCGDCHTNSNNYKVFSCILCHEHNNKNEVDNQHNGVSGYSYNSSACYSCHPQGKK